ncbi:type II secretion system protein GspJ [uncultured Roseovarius sp.]|uniref:type II secretion system protein GspJ n=1 Tax=uncultured Roseovarius sp. TaxID=293344 RepID=UPI0026274378|nr:type II secretion system protein GspJ [uncultured Roseovarius sp.]
MTHTNTSDRGLTLLELVAVLSIFALVAVMGLQSLSGMMHARDRLAEADEQAAALARGLTLLREDLKSADAAAFWPPATIEPQPAFLDFSAAQGWFALTTAGRAVLPEMQAAGQARVIWRHDREAERLTRQAWPVLRPASDAALLPETTVFERIAGLRLRAYASLEEGWVAGWGQPDLPLRPALPKAIEVDLESSAYGPLRVVVAYP